MISKNECLKVLEDMISNTTDENKKNKLIGYSAKINSITDEKFKEVAMRSLGENCHIEDFMKWINGRLNHELVGTEFIKLNDMVSYNIAGNKMDTIALHVVPKHVTTTDIRNMGPYLVDALNQLRQKVKSGEIEDVTNIFAVSDILKLRKLQEAFSLLGFDVGKGDEAFSGHFKNPYQAGISIEKILSKEWEDMRDEFCKNQPKVDVHAIAKMEQIKVDKTDQSDDSEDR